MWKIPVGKRYGCGYVFDSDLTTDEDAYEEICEVTGQKPHIRRKLNFKPEYHTKLLNKNTLALGLAQGFLEPLEATSLMITILALVNLHYKHLTDVDIFNRVSLESHTEEYNKKIMKIVDNCVDMVYIHYLTPRNDTEFWRNFKKVIPDQIDCKMNKFYEYDTQCPNDLSNDPPFHILSLLKCIAGVGGVDDESVQRNGNTLTQQGVLNVVNNIEKVCTMSKNHDDFLSMI
jgi:tryptophan halogenase